jgi:carboxylesterase
MELNQASPFIEFFSKPEHHPFLLEAGEPGVLLVHGFPGSPAEMRPLGEVFQQAGWTARGHLLPGFGPQIETIFERRYPEWVESVRQALVDMKRNHQPVLLAGFSMGAAVCLNAASLEAPDGLVLISPFWKLTGRIWSLLPLFSRLFPTIQPFRLIKLDFNNPEFKRGMALFMPEADLADPEIQRGIREFRVPVRIFAESQKVGRLGWQAASQVDQPTLVLQGRQDELVRTEQTRLLLARLAGSLTYHEFEAAHNLLDPSKPAWESVQAVTHRFGEEIKNSIPKTDPVSA